MKLKELNRCFLNDSCLHRMLIDLEQITAIEETDDKTMIKLHSFDDGPYWFKISYNEMKQIMEECFCNAKRGPALPTEETPKIE